MIKQLLFFVFIVFAFFNFKPNDETFHVGDSGLLSKQMFIQAQPSDRHDAEAPHAEWNGLEQSSRWGQASQV